MSKTNFSKVESALEEGLRQMSVNKLFDLADEASGKAPMQKNSEQKRILHLLQLNLARLQTVEKKIFSKLGIKKNAFKLLLQDPAEQKNWEQLQDLYQKSEALVKEFFPKLSDEEQVEKELNRHVNKRFNVNEKWLPLK